MGAVNAAIIATHSADSDHGVTALQNFWHSVSQDSVCFFPPFGELAAWNAVWTSLLFGGRGVFRPSVPLWTFMPPVTCAPLTKFYDTTVLESTLEGCFHKLVQQRVEARWIYTR